MLKNLCLYVRQLLKRLEEVGIQADVDKCEFHIQKTKFLGLIISTGII